MALPRPTVDQTIAAYERLLREYGGKPPRELVEPMIRQHGVDESVVIDRMVDAEKRLGYRFIPLVKPRHE